MMCQNCGCSEINNNSFLINKREIEIHRGILSKNNHIARHNREFFQVNGLFVINLLSSPGSGKTALIERMQIEQILQDGDSDNANYLPSNYEKLRHHFNLGVIVGDLATDNDAQRLQQKGIPALQITTGNACHLEANMVARAAAQLDLNSLDLLIIENVGNLVCPAAYDLGENLKMVMLSVTEGEDKPLKYPTMFKSAQIVVINKIDLAEVVEFDRSRAIANIRQIAPQAKIFEVSAKTGWGINSLLNYLFAQFLPQTSVI